jgi:hypothetical protein
MLAEVSNRYGTQSVLRFAQKSVFLANGQPQPVQLRRATARPPFELEST